MEEEGIGLVLARATELRLKISNCVNTATTTTTVPNANGTLPLPTQHADANAHHDSEDEDNEEELRLFNICDALESLETQLSSLQVLHQQQRYEKEVALAEIENSRRMLIDKLKEYKGKQLEVLHEALTFVSDTVEHNNDLLLPPYSSHSPYSMCLDKEYLSQIPSVNKSIRNGLITLDPEAKKSLSEEEQNHVEDGAKNLRKGLRFFITSAAKTMVTVVGVVSILRLSGFGPNLGKLATCFNVQGWLQQPENRDEIPTTQYPLGNEGERPMTQCPSGRILVVENGEARCLVKERVEIPFSVVSATPDINYGCG